MPYKKVLQENITLDLDKPRDNNSYEILVVEDDSINIEYIKEIFRHTYHKLTLAVNGDQALQALNNRHFDVILMDIRLPDINGLELSKQIRKNNNEVKIIAQTAYASIKDKKEALRSGCNAYISKPLQIDKLMDLLSN